MNNYFENKVKLEDKPCPLCCRKDDELLFKGHDRLHDLPGEFNVVRCRICGLMRTNPRPTLDTIGFYYPDNYGPYLGTKVEKEKIKERYQTIWKQLLQRIFQFNNLRMPSLRQGRLLEIGCASGVFLHQMALEGWDVTGIELSNNAGANASAMGYSIHIGPLETAPDPQEEYDLVVGWMVLEHLHDPVFALKKLHKWTKPGSWLIISLPNAGSYEFRLFRDCWFALHLPNHLFHFTPKTIGKVLNSGGWRLIKIHHQRVLYNLFPSIGYLLSDFGFKSRLIESLIEFPNNAGRIIYCLYPIAYILASLGQTGRMTAWARKA
jgi:2-polyprenyl-3-methyl-5-hydroxy-6-metoxy-1,4-benzoquinol methylase